MQALTILQPYASAIIDGPKRRENRTWRLAETPLWIAVHAGVAPFRYDSLVEKLRVHDAMVRHWPRMGALPWLVLPRGAVLGAMLIDRCERYETTPEARADWWACGPWCWHIARVVRLPEPRPCRGMQGLWRLPENIEAELWELIGRAP